ncbi:hypothetical protein DEU56DRAFT_916205 [Suillus clintonianus]|uniref:uncharacterized protein n=1 Tax=Suillus clintonianus TaxID=1904413 RepID=UPI001B87DC84|nr:uncharacterized protein DEU56DRAFT_916205 [Suillus clintonianus]KAG2126055.1 hypothetical protein DEU56DRAFT_916205 [Suillus clintonianus]
MSYGNGKDVELADVGPAKKNVLVTDLHISEGSVEVDDTNKEHLQPYSSSFFSPDLARIRREYFSIIFQSTGMTLLLMWILLSVYWAALAYSDRLTSNLTAWFIDRDNDTIGLALWAAINNDTSPGPRLGWSQVDPTIFASDEDVMQAVISEQIWLALVVETNATDKLSAARQTGNSTFNPTSLLTVYYATARHEVAIGTAVIPIYSNLLGEAVSSLATTSAQQYFARIYAQGQANETALQLIAQAPQTISPGIGWTTVDLRPFDAPVASASLVVGQAFQLIFTFIMVEANASARALVQKHLRLSSYLLLRFAVPLLIYVPMSLTYVLVSMTFGLPINAKFSATGGFFLMWIYVYLGTSTIGMSLESMVTVLPPRLTPFFLFLLITANLSSSVYPHELTPNFYRFGIAFPFWNVAQAMRTIVFNTHSYLMRNAGVLSGWIILSALTMTLFTCYRRGLEVKAAAKPKMDGRT